MTSPTASSPSVTCPSCHAEATGKFCSSCGASLVGTKCAACGATLTPGAKFCHRCGAGAGGSAAGSATAGNAGAPDPHSFSSALPWGVAAIALVALVALVAGQRFGRSQGDAAQAAGGGVGGNTAVAPFAGATGNGQAPDISNLTPAEAASRLYDRVMAAHENGHADTVQMFAPMAMTAYEMIGALNFDQRYDLGRIAAVAGDEEVARAQADTILAKDPNHLLGLILAGNAAHMRKDAAAERSYHAKLVAAAPAERAKKLDEYSLHANDIAIALGEKIPSTAP